MSIGKIKALYERGDLRRKEEWRCGGQRGGDLRETVSLTQPSNERL